MRDDHRRTPTTAGPDHLHSYHATRPEDRNRCGQAAVAALLDHHGLDPFDLEKPAYDPTDGRRHWDCGAVVDRVCGEFPPDHLFGLLGTTAARVCAALTAYGLEARAARSRSVAGGRGIWEEVKRFANAGRPVAVVLDVGRLGGPPFNAHWAVAYRVEGSTVRLANCGRAPRVSEERFLRAFRCRLVPGVPSYRAVFARKV